MNHQIIDCKAGQCEVCPELCVGSARTVQGAVQPGTSSGRCVSSPASSCDSRETTGGLECPPETPGSIRPSVHQTDGSCTQETTAHLALSLVEFTLITDHTVKCNNVQYHEE